MQVIKLYKALNERDFVTCWSRRWVSAPANPFPAGDYKSAGILQCPTESTLPFNKM